MIENYDHYITRSIRSVYKRKLIAPLLYLLALAALWFLFPLPDLLFPKSLTDYGNIGENYKNRDVYVEAELSDLYFTGYTNTLFGMTTGYYYYTVADGQCMFVLLTPRTCEEGLPFIEQVRIRGQILSEGRAYQQLADALAEDLSWTPEGLTGKVSSYLLSEPAFHSILGRLSLFLFFATGLYALLVIVSSIVYLSFPVLSPPCRRLGRFGKPSELLAQAEEELATLPQLATEDMFITEHYFIEIADSGIAVVPIREIIWIYKYSTLHKLFWYHFNISYTLHITTTRHLHLQCPKNRKTDIDGIIDYLAEANHDILVGFSEKNRLKVQEMQHPKLRFERLIAFLNRKF